MTKFTPKTITTSILAAIAIVSAFGLFCEYGTDDYSKFVTYYIGCALITALSIFLIWFIQDMPKAIKTIKAIAKVTYMYIKRYVRIAIGTVIFLDWCRKHHKTLSWTYRKYISLLKGE